MEIWNKVLCGINLGKQNQSGKALVHMAASVRIEDEAFSDERYEDLAELAGLADSDHARGKMARIWRQCTIEGTHVVSNSIPRRVLGPNAIDALVGARLAEIVDENHVRIRGTAGRIEWLKRVRENGKYGKHGGRPRKSAPPKKTQEGFANETQQGGSNETPPAPAPAPTKEKNIPPPEDLELCRRLARRIVKNHPTTELAKLSPSDLEKRMATWAKHVRLMRERDGHSRDEIAAVIDWCQSDQFWHKNILSTETLRVKWDKLVAQMPAKAPRKQPVEQPKLTFQLGDVEVER